MNEVEQRIIEALQFIAPSKFYDYLRLQPEELIVSVVGQASRWCHMLADSRSKLDSELLIATTIKEAEEYRRKKPGYYVEPMIEKMLRVSARLLRKELSSLTGDAKIHRGKVVSYSLKVFGHASIGGEEKGLFFGLLRDCGKSLSIQEIRKTLDNPNAWAGDEEKRFLARNLLCAGYIDYNGAEKAFVALENDPFLSSVQMLTPDDEIIESLKAALRAFDVDDWPSVNRAKALFFSARLFPGPEKAEAAVMEVRPDLVGQFTDDSGKTFGRKAE